MLAPAPRGRIIALDLLSLSPYSPLSAQWMIAVKTTRFDDGHVLAWCIEQDGEGRSWPTKVRLNNSLLYSSNSGPAMHAMGIKHRWSLSLGPTPICLDDFETICLRAPMPDEELGEDHRSWCLDILFKLERLHGLVRGQALQLETFLGLDPDIDPNSSLDESIKTSTEPSHITFHAMDKRSTSETPNMNNTAQWPRERPLTPDAMPLHSHDMNKVKSLTWPPLAIKASSLVV